jgi:hypothetical protein
MRRGFVALVSLSPAILLLGACSRPSPTTVPLYARVPVPAVPDRTAPVSKLPADGQYWSPKVVAKNGQLVFSLAQAFFGPTCTTELGADRCPNGFGTNEAGATSSAGYGQVTVAAASLSVVTVTAANGRNFAIDGTELAHLVDGGAPSASAPTDFRYSPGPYLVTVSAGGVTAANEVSVG